MEEPLLQLKSVRIIHTLGPCGTNCEAAAYYWLSQNCLTGEVKLHSTLEFYVARDRATVWNHGSLYW